MDALIWIVVSSAAIMAGILLARHNLREDGWWLKRGKCPSCKARKLLPEPISEQSVVILCAKCGEQWLVESDNRIVEWLAPRATASSVLLTFSQQSSNPIFRTKVGFSEYDLRSIKPQDVAIVSTRSPRQFLAVLHELRIAPIAVTLEPEHVKLCEDAGTEPYDYFMDSAGIDH
jgi:hypothetical protein